MASYFDIYYFKRTARINCVLLTIYLSVSIVCHVVANRLILINGYPIISAGLIYMSIFVLTDVLASYNSRKLVIFIIFLEAIANLTFISFANFVSHLPHPDYFNHVKEYETVFSPIFVLYLANLIGGMTAALVDLFIFYFLYKIKGWIFFFASVVSSIATLTCYTYITDYFGFRGSYPQHVMELTNINFITNIITLICYAIIGQMIVPFIHKYVSGLNN